MIFPLILLGLSIITHMAFFGWPAQVVFDEVHNGKFITSYATDSYYFDVHPPLAKLLTKFFGDFINAPYDVDYGAIGNTLPWGVILLRLLPIITGILLPIIIYYICRNLSFSKLVSFAAGALVVLENSLLVQSRFILFDSIMLLFGFTSVLLYLIYIKKQRRWMLYLSVVLATLAFSVKWTGFAYPLLICGAEIIRLKNFRKSIRFVAHYVFIGLFIYMVIFAFHFAYLRHSGPGDPFMTDRFQKTLIDNPHANDPIEPKKFFGKFIELNVEMYEANQTLNATHAYSSNWLSWPLMIRPIFYWQGKSNVTGNQYIYLLGNPLIYWLGFLSVLFLIWRVIKRKHTKVLLFILTGFLVNYIPFIFIGRVMFLYHYEAALVFSILAICYILQYEVPEAKRAKVTWALLIVCLVLFIYFAPLTYGTHLSDAALKARMWLPTWR